MGQRRKGREGALQVLYQLEAMIAPKVDAERNVLPASGIEEALNRFFENFDAATPSQMHIEELVRGVVAKQPEIDALVECNSPCWRVARMAMVDRNVLRIAALELLDASDLPIRVIIDEAIEIARRYGSEKSAAFVNGILDPLAKEVRGKTDA
jgi:N utilization substance protein B